MLLLVGRHVKGHPSAYQQLQVMYSISPQQVMHPAHAPGNMPSTLCGLLHGLYDTPANIFQIQQACTNLYLFINLISYYSTPKK